MFNGNGFKRNTNDSNRFMYAGRLALHLVPIQKNNRWKDVKIGFSLAHSTDRNAALGGGFISNFEGERVIQGVDFRITQDRIFFSGEIVRARLEPNDGQGQDAKPVGYHLSGGYKPVQNWQVLARWDSFSPDGIRPDSDRVILGVNFWPVQTAEFQLNYLIPSDGDVESHRILMNAQFSF